MSFNKTRLLISDAETKQLECYFNNKFVEPMKDEITDMRSTVGYDAQLMSDWLDSRLKVALEYVAFLKNKIEQLEDEHNEAVEGYECKIALLEEGNDLSQDAYYRDLQDEIATLKDLLNEGGVK